MKPVFRFCLFLALPTTLGNDNAIAGWINLTYTDFHRQRLRGLADRISRHPQRLQDWARRLLQARGYVTGGGKYNWAETVRYANMAM